MLTLDEIPLFRKLDEPTRTRLAAAAELRLVRAGNLVLRRGAHGRELLVVASGGVSVRPDLSTTATALGPGEFVGEMSLMSGRPVSATVTATRDTHLWAVPGPEFLALVEAQPLLAAELLRNLCRRLRQREASAARAPAPQVVLLSAANGARELPRALLAAVDRHAPAVELEHAHSSRAVVDTARAWRSAAAADNVLLLVVPDAEIDGMQRALEAGDAVLQTDAASASDATAVVSAWGLADQARLRLDPGATANADDRWAFPLSGTELERVAGGAPPLRATTPKLDRLARWIARKEIGVALGAGAARGFAHLGVLAELEALGLPIDRLAGTSMGGIAALLYGLGGNGEQGIKLAAATLGRPRPARWRWLPRSALLSDRELRRRARAVAGTRNFGDLSLPVSVVASDLVSSARVVVDRGSVADGFFATSAVPGVLPPVAQRDRVLVDGALVTRLPLDLLPRSRCALRIAVNVIPSPDAIADAHAEARELQRRFARPLGFREVLARSWLLHGWVHGARDAADADILLEPRTREHSGVDFANNWSALVEAGRAVVREQAAELTAAAADLLGPDHFTSPAPASP